MNSGVNLLPDYEAGMQNFMAEVELCYFDINIYSTLFGLLSVLVFTSALAHIQAHSNLWIW